MGFLATGRRNRPDTALVPDRDRDDVSGEIGGIHGVLDERSFAAGTFFDMLAAWTERLFNLALEEVFLLLCKKEQKLVINRKPILYAGRHGIWFVPNDGVSQDPTSIRHSSRKPQWY